MTTNCQRCNSARIIELLAAPSSLRVIFGKHEADDCYVPYDIGIGGDNIKMKYCLECGQIQGNWPMAPCELERRSAK